MTKKFNERTEQRLLIIALYHTLHDEYCRVFGPNSAPEYFKNETGEREINFDFPNPVGDLVPSHNDWYYLPEADGPERMGLHPFLSDQALSPSVLFFDSVDTCEVDNKIRHRAWAHRLRHHSEAIFVNSINEAKDRLALTIKEYNKIRKDAHDDTSSILDEWGVTPIYRSQLLIEEKIRLLRLRLHWLQIWDEWETPRRKTFNLNSVSNVAPKNFSALVKPKDINEVNERIQDALDDLKANQRAQQSFHDSKLPKEDDIYAPLGRWYAITLWRCGASDAELNAIRAGKVQKDGSVHLREWSEVARLKYKRQT